MPDLLAELDESGLGVAAFGERREGFPIITIDGFKLYAPAIRLVFGPVCVLGQVIKKSRVARVPTKLVSGSQWRLNEALAESKDSTKFRTGFAERRNMTIRP